ncbi:MAG TPA: aldehyde dehydrogenase family protein [Planctomycetes bacterium]|nr:aldehyde dehydrogenase family protein [Planctomycetota bacterium]
MEKLDRRFEAGEYHRRRHRRARDSHRRRRLAKMSQSVRPSCAVVLRGPEVGADSAGCPEVPRPLERAAPWRYNTVKSPEGRAMADQERESTVARQAGRAGGDLEAATRQIGAELLAHLRRQRPGLLARRFWSDRLMRWAMQDPGFKVQLFRFVDVFPMLEGGDEIHEYLVEYLSQRGVQLPWGMGLGLKAGGLAKGALARTVARQIEGLARQFIAGEDASAALPQLHQLWQEGVAFTVDLLGEACLSDAEAEQYRDRYLELIRTLAHAVRRWERNPRLESDHLGAVPRANVSIKISSLAARVDPIDLDRCIQQLVDALRPLLVEAARAGVLVNFDMEQYALKDLTLALFERCCEEVEFPAGLALQAYLRGAEEDAHRIIRWAQGTGRQVTVRLIKGAYWDHEVIQARQKGWPVPVWTGKAATDACFERMAELLVGAVPRRSDAGGVKLAVGSHNLRSIARVLALVDRQGLPESAIEVQMLFGMADALKAAVLARGLRLREYVPVGQLIPGMAYLVRRLLENTSNQSWLRAGLAEGASDEALLASPHDAAGHQPPEGAGREHEGLAPVFDRLDGGRPFMNEPPRDFSRADQRDRFRQTIATVRLPPRADEVTPRKAEEVVERAASAAAAWRDRDPLDRARLIVEAARRMQACRDELAGLVIREAGKTWREADADVCEAIDFCHFYARHAVRLLQPQTLGHFVGESNQLVYEPRGVAVIISPWNFPLAICAGMTTAALVTGNVAVVKPAGPTVGIAQRMCRILWEAGVSEDVVRLVVGPGRSVGAALVRDPRVALVAFTGSKEVGLEIIEAASRSAQKAGLVKKVVCEMGGKNAIIVDESADLDQAVPGVRDSAFGYSGQKCSACSRVIVLDRVFDVFLRRLIEATRSLAIGDPMDPGTDVGPVIHEAAAEKIWHYIRIGKEEGRLELACPVPPGIEARVGKPFVGPHIFSGIQPLHRLANEEIFGPVLSVMRAEDFRQALDWANASSFKLTGGIYSRKPSHLEQARRHFRVGNLYLNRGITGALVGRQPFGGLGLSGTGTKAGGADYLLHFVAPRTITENTTRHGFAPGLES